MFKVYCIYFIYLFCFLIFRLIFFQGTTILNKHILDASLFHARLLVPHVINNMHPPCANTATTTNAPQPLCHSTNNNNTSQQQADEICELKRCLHDESTKNSILANEVCNLKRELGQANEKIGSLEKDMSVVRSTFEALVVELNNLKKQHQQQCPVEERVTKLEEKTDQLNLETNNAKNQVEENNATLVRCDERLQNLNSNLSDVDLRQQILENTTFGGRFIWKIDHLKYRLKQSALGNISALHSAPCYTKRFGYKFCTRLYLNGDGIGKDTHISLFIVIMKSEYDALLEWPFRQKVTFNLLNHANQNDSVKESFVPDIKSPSFKRPNKDMNLAAGCPMFVSKERLENYIVDDSIFIETAVGDM